MSPTIINIAVFLLSGIGAYLIKNFFGNLFGRIDMLEAKIQQMVTEPTVRQIVADKLDPIKDDLTEIKDSIKKLFDLYVQEQQKKNFKN